MSSLVAGHQTPTKKAPRASTLRACERCRRRKRRCDEYFPCGSCTRLGIQCQVSEPERRQEKSQSYLEARVKRLESLLVERNPMHSPQHHHQFQLPLEGPSYSSAPMHGGPSKLRLQIPSAPAYSRNEPDWYSTLSSNYSNSPTPGSPHQAHSPMDFPTALDIPQWSSQILDSEPSPFVQSPLPRRRALSSPFPLSEGEDNQNLPDTSFNFSIENDFLSTNIPTIQVTSWDTESNVSSETRGMGRNDYSLMAPELSVGSWSGPPSPTFTATSQQLGIDDTFVMNSGSCFQSRRSSFALSDRSFDGLDLSDLRTADTAFKPRPKALLLPQTQIPYYSAPALPASLQSHETQMQYANSFFDKIQPLFPVISQAELMPMLCQATSAPMNDYDKASLFLILSIGCHLMPDEQPNSLKYYALAQQYLDVKVWPCIASLEAKRSYILLALCRLICIDSEEKPAMSLYMLDAYIGASCIDSGIHQQYPSDEESDIFFSAYALDRTINVVTGKPHVLHDSDVDGLLLERLQHQAKRAKDRLQNDISSCGLEECCGRLLDWYKMTD